MYEYYFATGAGTTTGGGGTTTGGGTGGTTSGPNLGYFDTITANRYNVQSSDAFISGTAGGKGLVVTAGGSNTAIAVAANGTVTIKDLTVTGSILIDGIGGTGTGGGIGNTGGGTSVGPAVAGLSNAFAGVYLFTSEPQFFSGDATNKLQNSLHEEYRFITVNHNFGHTNYQVIASPTVFPTDAVNAPGKYLDGTFNAVVYGHGSNSFTLKVSGSNSVGHVNATIYSMM